ncbi:transposase (plasmid) [Levilactobacillus suantsaii]|nr:transposase [Levilactobacillus suantsaii]
MIKQRTQLSDRELVAAIRDTPAYQYFIGLPEYQPQAPFSFSALSYFRHRIVPLSELITNIIFFT